jgi:hypothetical protein
VLAAACTRPAVEEELPLDSITTGAAPAPAAGGPALEADDEPVVSLAPDIRRACAAVQWYWSGQPGVVTRVRDSVVTLPGGAGPGDACWVSVRIEEDRRIGGEFRVPFAASGWLPIYEFDASGPDGQARVYQLDPVRCLVEERWDGGDDADSTYQPQPWFAQSVACYRRR